MGIRPSKRWGNTNKARGKIRRWSKAQAEAQPGFRGVTKWRAVEKIRLLDPDEVEALADNPNLPDSVRDEIDAKGENAEVYEIQGDIKTSVFPVGTEPQTLEGYQETGWLVEDDFRITDLFTARGRNWSERSGFRGGKGRGAHIEGHSQEFDYFVFEIETPVSKGKA